VSDFNSVKNRVVWVDIPVADLDRSAAFYAAVMGIKVSKQSFGEDSFCVLEHEEGNGGCLVLNKAEVSGSTGILVYLNVHGRIRDAAAQVEQLGGRVLEAIHPIGPHGFRAIVIDSEGNRVALHSQMDA
jgi:uncharacterized protein